MLKMISPRAATLAALCLASACTAMRAPEVAPSPITAAPLAASAELDQFIEGAMADMGVVQGLSVAVFTPDGVYARGFGVADMETSEPVSADTVFYIASATKSFTGLAMNILDHRGEIDLDASLVDYAPDANFPDEIKPNEVSLRSLLTHTSGISNSPISWRAAFTGQHSPQKNWALLAASTPNEESPLGTYQYTNTGYNILTILTDKKLGVPWQDLIAREILDPAGMTNTSAYMSKAVNENWSIARPHFNGYKDGPVRIRLEKTDATMQSAGGMVMSANDALRWLELLSQDGVIGGAQIIPAEIIRETRAPLAEVGESRGHYQRDHYGLGWNIGPYKDDVLVHHFGGFAGFRSHISYMPERKIGVAAFVNDSIVGSPLTDVIANYAYDLLTGKEDALETANADLAQLVVRRDRIFEGIATDAEKRAKREWKLSQPLSTYAGIYENDLYGVMEVREEDGALKFTFGNLNAIAEPFTRDESVRLELTPFRGEVIVFNVDDSSGVSGLTYSDDVFAKRP